MSKVIMHFTVSVVCEKSEQTQKLVEFSKLFAKHGFVTENFASNRHWDYDEAGGIPAGIAVDSAAQKVKVAVARREWEQDSKKEPSERRSYDLDSANETETR